MTDFHSTVGLKGNKLLGSAESRERERSLPDETRKQLESALVDYNGALHGDLESYPRSIQYLLYFFWIDSLEAFTIEIVSLAQL